MARARRSFTKEYKAEVVKLIRTSGKSVGAVSRELGLTETRRPSLSSAEHGRYLSVLNCASERFLKGPACRKGR